MTEFHGVVDMALFDTLYSSALVRIYLLIQSNLISMMWPITAIIYSVYIFYTFVATNIYISTTNLIVK